MTGEAPIILRDGREVRIRPVQSGDTELFLDYFDGLSPESRDFMHGWEHLGGRQQAESFAHSVQSPDHCAAMATAGMPERMVGYCWIDGVQSMTIPMLGIGLIDAYHEIGLGSHLLRWMIAHAGTLGIARVQLGVFSDNARAMHVYEKAGFRSDPSLPPKIFGARTEVYLVVDTGVA